jgi:hypothetical protein
MRAKSTRRRGSAEQKSNRARTYIIWGVIILGIAALGALLYLSLQEPQALDDLQRFAGLARGHDETVDYSGQELPPVGGIHSGVWQNCGIYTEPVDSKNAIHSMEHGAVWIAYQTELPAGDVQALQDAARGQRFVLLTPYPGLKSPVVLTAWGIQLELDSADDARIPEFIDRYQQGPQTPELGATCQDGLGDPIN